MLTAITGTIGSGKSEVIRILKNLGYKTISCDEINAELLTKDSYIKIIEQNFPKVVKKGVIDKKALSDLIFRSKSAREKLNSISHPLILKKLKEEILKLKGDIFVEIPLLSKNIARKMFDRVWVVTSLNTTNLNRIMLRDNISINEAKKKLNSQTKKLNYGIPTYVIINDKDREKLLKQIKKLICIKS